MNVTPFRINSDVWNNFGHKWAFPEQRWGGNSITSSFIIQHELNWLLSVINVNVYCANRCFSVCLFVSLSFLDDCTHMVDYDYMIIFCNRNLWLTTSRAGQVYLWRTSTLAPDMVILENMSIMVLGRLVSVSYLCSTFSYSCLSVSCSLCSPGHSCLHVSVSSPVCVFIPPVILLKCLVCIHIFVMRPVLFW